MDSTRRAATVLGVLVIAIAAWGAIVAYVGPAFGFDMGTTTSAWVWTRSHTTLDLAPGVVGIVGGLLMVVAHGRAMKSIGALLALIGGVWFMVGPSLEPLWQTGGVTTTGSAGSSGTTLVRALEAIGYHYGTGAVLAVLSAFALGLLVAPSPLAVASAGPADQKDQQPQVSFSTPSHA
jgi:hypothetical protein